jgi:hypothetical protein
VEKGSAEKKHYDFCSVMLNHTVGTAPDTRRGFSGTSIEQYHKILHPHFAHLGDMLYYMGRYFLIDPKTWSNYNEDPLGHAYYFMELLVLGEILQNEGRSNPLLNTTKPRPATDPTASAPDRAEANEGGRATEDENEGKFLDLMWSKRSMSHRKKPSRPRND